MKNIILSIAFTIISVSLSAQRVHKITFTNNGASTSFGFLLNEDVVINLSQDGSMESWGVDLYASRTADYLQRPLKPYEGRVEYYTERDNEAFRSKIKYIGGTLITYYANYDEKFLIGKIKAIGPINITYYSRYDDPSSEGKLKNIGQLNLAYYSSFDNDAYKGKVKTLGNIGVTYYNAFDDKAYAGKIKSLGPNNYVYYSSMEQQYLRGALKSGNMIQVMNGITFYIR